MVKDTSLLAKVLCLRMVNLMKNMQNLTFSMKLQKVFSISLSTKNLNSVSWWTRASLLDHFAISRAIYPRLPPSWEPFERRRPPIPPRPKSIDLLIKQIGLGHSRVVLKLSCKVCRFWRTALLAPWSQMMNLGGSRLRAQMFRQGSKSR